MNAGGRATQWRSGGLRIVFSKLKADEPVKKLLARIHSFDFGAKDVDVMVVTWPVNFLGSVRVG